MQGTTQQQVDYDDPEISEALQRAFAVLDRWPEPEPREEYLLELTPQQYRRVASFILRLGGCIEPVGVGVVCG